ncbi:hypothetical protein D9619_001245 [Psilocybe cf. subviscida]|uniref:Transcription elongation factor Eaf N-terminal domain-containing protein n=1 Tax=Psilocybe cf. subviscida TaxID=2480587 RepID=A0A8H5BGE0_9AGAR|nr:hypothetical protein D9619_001245 [Psilocybe cf. subviscida]
MASSSTSWMPPAGKYPVNIGSSLGRAIKNRKLKDSPAPTTARRSNLPEREFYSFKFNFKPVSIDTTKPATLDIKKGATNTQVVAEYPATHSGQVHPFDGSELRAKDVDCVLIYDEDTGQYTIEKVESFINLSSLRMKAASPRTAIGSPAAASTPASTSSVKGKSSSADDDVDVVAQRDEEEEREEGEEIELPPPRAVKPLPASRLSPKPPPPPAPQLRAPPPPTVSAPAMKKPSPPPPAAKPRPQPRPKKPKPAAPAPAPAPTTSYSNEEVFDVVRPTKRGRPSPPPAPAPKPAPPPVRKPPAPPPAPVVRPPVSLSLPGGPAVFEPPPPAVPVAASAALSLPIAALPVVSSEPASPQMIGSDSEDDDDWEQVPTTAPPPPMTSLPVTAAVNNFMDSPEAGTFNDTLFEEIDGDALFGDDGDDGDGDEGEEIDADMLEGVLNETLEDVDSDEDFIGAAVEKAVDDAPPRQPIMSLNRFADGGVTVNDSDEDFSSSDESDDD